MAITCTAVMKIPMPGKYCSRYRAEAHILRIFRGILAEGVPLMNSQVKVAGRAHQEGNGGVEGNQLRR